MKKLTLKELKNLKFNNINKILTNWNKYVHVDGHSDYDKSFKDLLDEKIISNSSFNTLIVIGDARNNYRPINTETIDKLSKKVSEHLLDESRKKPILEHR
mgnify:CR=1 FL=1